MKFASLGSGSKGNATLVKDRNCCLMIDCGFSVRETERRLKRLQVSPAEISAVLVTHEHADHARGVAAFTRKYKTPVYMTAGTRRAINDNVENLHLIASSHEVFHCESFAVTPVAVPHDAREPVQYVLRNERHALGLLTDLGTITPHVLENFSHCDGMLLEANHDSEMLANGPYPPSLKRRVGGDWGHLNNSQARWLLERVCIENIQQLVLGHISEKNNCVSLVRETVSDIAATLPSVHYACQDHGFDWIELS